MKFVSEPAKYNNLSTGVPPIHMTCVSGEPGKYNNLSTGVSADQSNDLCLPQLQEFNGQNGLGKP